MRHGQLLHAFALASSLFAGVTHAEPLPEPMRAVDGMLQRMDVDAECRAVAGEIATCRYRQPLPESDAARWIQVRHLPERRMLYLVVEEYFRAAPQAPKTPALLRRLMELNWELLTPKLAWDPRTGEVRMSAVLSIRGGVDSQALRAALQALREAAGRCLPQLRAFVDSPSTTQPDN